MAQAQIFLIYAQEDENRVSNLYKKLSDSEFKPWMDEENLYPGQYKPETLEKAIRQSDFILVCLSANSVSQAGLFQKQLKDAVDLWQRMPEDSIFLIPVRLEECQIPYSLERFQRLDLFERDGWERLVKAIRAGMERRGNSLSNFKDAQSAKLPQSIRTNQIVSIEFELNGTLDSFNEKEFKAALQDVIRTDIKKIRITNIQPGSVKVTVEGEAEELARIIKSLQDSAELERQFAQRTGLVSISYLQGGRWHTPHARHPASEPAMKQNAALAGSHTKPTLRSKSGEPWLINTLGTVIGFFVGVLGNLVAGWIQQEWLNPFTPPQFVVIVLLTIVGLFAGIWLSRRPLLFPKLPGIKDQLLARGLALVLIAIPIAVLSGVLLATFAGARNYCIEVKVSHLELYLATSQSYPEGKVIELDRSDILNRGNLSGRVAFSNPAVAAHCACEWWGETDQRARQRLTEPKGARDCSFSIPLQEGVKEIALTLNVGKQAPLSGFRQVKFFDFNIKVRPKSK